MFLSSGRERQGWVNGEVWRVDMKERGREGQEATDGEMGRGRGRGDREGEREGE